LRKGDSPSVMGTEPIEKSEAMNNALLCLKLDADELLSEALVKAGEKIALPCNGRGSCGKCRAIVDGALFPPNDIEQQHLSSDELAAGVRLTCQARSSGGEVRFYSLPKVSDFGILVDGIGTAAAVDSNLSVTKLTLDQPTHDSLSEWHRIVAAGTPSDPPPLSMLQRLPTALAEATESLEVATFAQRLASIRPAGSRQPYYGIAYDIGTTTMVAYLVNLSNGKVVAALPRSNPQAAHGADVMSRIHHASQPSGLEQLNRELVAGMDDMAATLALQAGLAFTDIVAITAVGNTCMHHLLLGISPVSLGQSPYLPVFTEELFTWGKELGLARFAHCLVWTGPVVGGFVGADAVAAGVAGQLLRDEQPRLLIDLGTNGEILLSAHGRILACSAAAGPAFEGVQISCGMRAQEGAIDGFVIDDDGVKLHVLGEDAAPVGICGSGLIDAVAEMLRVGIIDETGRINSPTEVAASAGKAVASRLVEQDGSWGFQLTTGENALTLTQGDIREVQLAKGAIRAAIEICCDELQITSREITQVLLAGAFGNYIRKDNAVRLGLLPEIPLRRISSVGNAAGAGAVLALTSQQARAASIALAAQAVHVDLGGHLAFQEKFVDAMFFL
jgi:uncharacterized 2Fe-2S/4Fe-4S cluster protein (DUF4445 family)